MKNMTCCRVGLWASDQIMSKIINENIINIDDKACKNSCFILEKVFLKVC